MIRTEQISAIAQSLEADIIAIRRHIHQNPELSFQEFETAAFVTEKLKSFGINTINSIAETGIVAIIEGKEPKSKTIALRADLDALPIQELTNVDYRSQHAGIMHACGHDVHTACLLGAAKILNDTKMEWTGTIKLIFQPGEEKLPGGASMLIQEKVLESPQVETIIGQHVMPFLPVGTVGFRSGLYMASSDELYIEIIGKGGHGAMPHLCLDPVPVAAQIILALQQLISRKNNPLVPSVLTIGKIIANGATNVIPDRVHLEGTFRTFDETWRTNAHKEIEQTCQQIAKAFGQEAVVNIVKGYPFLNNNPELTQRAKNAAIAYLGAERVVDLDAWMASEDFAYYSQLIPATFYRLGTANPENGIVHGVHNPMFNVDEAALKIGAGLMAWIAIQELENLKS
jgi:amidohydrolase